MDILSAYVGLVTGALIVVVVGFYLFDRWKTQQIANGLDPVLREVMKKSQEQSRQS